MNFVLFLDESGDHNLLSIDRNFPVFCLAGCIFDRSYYHHTVRPRLDAFKMQFWNTTQVILHSREIRKHQGAFSFLDDRDRRESFYATLNALIQGLEFTILAIVILKQAHLNEYGLQARHPYHLSLEFILERYSLAMRRRGRESTGYILAESRGKREDRLLKAEGVWAQSLSSANLRSLFALENKNRTRALAGPRSATGLFRSIIHF
jgi:hypothetical protein